MIVTYWTVWTCNGLKRRNITTYNSQECAGISTSFEYNTFRSVLHYCMVLSDAFNSNLYKVPIYVIDIL